MKRALPVAVAVGVVMVLLSAVLASDIDWDEGMYIAAGALGRDHVLYRDFSYVQAPYLPLFFTAVFRLVGGTHLLLLGRLCNLPFALAAVATLYFMVRRASGSVVAVCVMALFLCNDLVQLRIATSTNDVVAMATALMACALLVRLVEARGVGPAWRPFAVGALLSLALATKVYYATLGLPAALTLLLLPERRLRSLLLYALGAVVALVPAAMVWRSSPEATLFNNIGFHWANAAWRAAVTDGGNASRLLMAWHQWSLPGCFAAFTLLALTAVTADDWRARVRRVDGVGVATVFAATLAVTALLPTPPWPHYFALPIPFVLLAAGLWHGQLSPSLRSASQRVFVVVTVGLGLIGGLRLAKFVLVWRHPSGGSVQALHEEAADLRARVTAPGPLATLFPLYATDGGFALYPELASGAFVYRLGDRLPADQRARLHLTSPSTVGALFDAQPPAAVLVGFETEHHLEDPLVDWAVAHHYTKQALTLLHRTATLYTRSAAD